MSRQGADAFLRAANSTWLGGSATENGGLHERLPYWLNGAVPMAYLLTEPLSNEQPQTSLVDRCGASDNDDAKVVFTARRALQHAAEAATKADVATARSEAVRANVQPKTCPVREHAAGTRAAAYSLRNEVRTMLDYIVDHQSDAGWLGGPANDNEGDHDQYWIGWDVVYALMQFAEAEPKEAPRVEAALLRYVAETARRMRAAPLDGWSSVRWPELAAILQRMSDTFDLGPESAERAMLLSTAALVQQQGFNWRAYFTDASASPNFNTSVPFAPGWTLTEHGVNHAMALKEGGVAWRAGEGPAAVAFSRLRVQLLDAAHGMPSGTFSADECLGGREPNRGVELCTIVETAFSLAFLHRTHGDIEFADRAERIVLNQLPGAVSEDMWSHNYLSQSNEIFAGHTEPHAWRTDGPDSTAYGLAPTYACCTANFIQGWPKWAAGLMGYRLKPDGSAGTVVVSFFGPAEADFPLSVGGGAHVVMDTEYPFEDVVRLAVDAPAGVDVDIRIPAWPGTAQVVVNDEQPITPQRGAYHTVRCPPGSCSIVVTFEPEIVVTPGWGDNGGVSVSRGPLLFALPLSESWTELRAYEFGSKDWEVSTNTSWNFALLLSGGEFQHALQVEHSTLAAPPDAAPFASSAPRVWLNGHARRCDAWRSSDGGHTADSPPPSPACGANGKDGCGPIEKIRLVPFGNTRLRIAVMPYTVA